MAKKKKVYYDLPEDSPFSKYVNDMKQRGSQAVYDVFNKSKPNIDYGKPIGPEPHEGKSWDEMSKSLAPKPKAKTTGQQMIDFGMNELKPKAKPAISKPSSNVTKDVFKKQLDYQGLDEPKPMGIADRVGNIWNEGLKVKDVKKYGFSKLTDTPLNIIGESPSYYFYNHYDQARNTNKVERINKSDVNFDVPGKDKLNQISSKIDANVSERSKYAQNKQDEFKKLHPAFQAFEKIGSSGAKALLGGIPSKGAWDSASELTTGDNVSDKVADFVYDTTGMIAGLGYNQGTIGSTLLGSSNTLASKIMSKAGLASKIAPKSKVVRNIANEAIEGMATMPLITTYDVLAQGMSPEEAAKRYGTDLLTGAAFGGALGAATQLPKALKSTIGSTIDDVGRNTMKTTSADVSNDELANMMMQDYLSDGAGRFRQLPQQEARKALPQPAIRLRGSTLAEQIVDNASAKPKERLALPAPKKVLALPESKTIYAKPSEFTKEVELPSTTIPKDALSEIPNKQIPTLEEYLRLNKDYTKAVEQSNKASKARMNLPQGSSRARTTTANARWSSAAENRDRIETNLINKYNELYGKDIGSKQSIADNVPVKDGKNIPPKVQDKFKKEIPKTVPDKSTEAEYLANEKNARIQAIKNRLVNIKNEYPTVGRTTKRELTSERATLQAELRRLQPKVDNTIPPKVSSEFKRETPFIEVKGRVIDNTKNVSDRPNVPGNKADYVRYPEQYTPTKTNYPNKAGTKETVGQTLADKYRLMNANKATETPQVQPIEKQVIKSTRELPNFKDIDTPEKFATHYKLNEPYKMDTVKNMVDDVGARVINKVGSNDADAVLQYYRNKYNLPNIILEKTLRSDKRLGNSFKIKGSKDYRINLNPNQSTEGLIGSLRHEIEHVMDLSKGYKPLDGKVKFKQGMTTKEFATLKSKGHHSSYDWFEADYLYNALKKDASKVDVPEQITKENVPIRSTTTPVDNVAATSETVTQPASETIKFNGDTITTPTGKTRKFKTYTNREIREVGTERERGLSRNVKTSNYTEDTLRTNLDNDPLTYNQTTLKEIQRVADEKYKAGYDISLKNFRESDTFDPSDFPLAKMLANDAVKKGDIETAREIISIAADRATEAGRLVVANKILREADPTSFVTFIQRKVNKINKQGKEIYGKKWKTIELADDDFKEIYNLELFDESTFKQQSERIYNRINEQLPVTTIDKMDSWRRMAMLLNPKTHIRNVIGNAIMMPLRKGSDTLAAGMEKVLLPKEQRTKSLGWSRDKELVDIVKNDWEAHRLDLTEGGRYDIERLKAGTQEKQIFKTKWLERINQFSKDILNAGDVPFLGRAYRDALGGFMKARGIREVTEEARIYATNRAKEATYRQANAFSNWIAQLKSKPGAKRFAAEAVIPFSKTPSNIAMRAIEYSPAGLLKALYSKSKGKDAAMVIEDLAKGMTGTGVFALGLMLSDMGFLTGEKNKSKKIQAIDDLEGKQGYSINTPLGSYTFDWAVPLSIPLAMGVALYNGISKKYPDGKGVDKLINTMVDSVSASGETAVNMSMLRSIKDLFGGYGTVTEKVLGLAGNYASQFIPTVSGQLARSVDGTKRSTYDTNPISQYGRSVMSKIPGASMKLEPKLDVFGRNVKQGNAGEQFLSPGFYNSNKKDPIVNALSDLHDSTGNNNMLPKVAPKSFSSGGEQIMLSPKEMTQFQRTMGQRNYNDIKSLMDSSGYYSLEDDTEKAKAIEKIVSNNYDYAKEELFKKRGNMPEVEMSEYETKAANKQKRERSKRIDAVLESVLSNE